MNEFLIANADSGEERWTGERCYIRERLNHSRCPAVSLAEARVEAGTTTEWHRLGVDEWYLIRSGRGAMQVGEAPAFDVAAGDVVHIPAGQPQRITNTGGSDLRFDCLCLPRFSADCYESLE